MAKEERLGIGMYSRQRVAELTRVRLRSLNRWIHGYRYTASGGRSGQVDALITPAYEPVGTVEALSFRDLVELLFVAGFRREGVSLQHIRAAASAAAEKYETRHPFALRQFSTDGDRIFASIDEGLEDVVSGQFNIERVLGLYLRQLEYDLETGEATLWWPRGKSRGVVVDPRRSFGEPIIDASAVPTRSIYAAYAAEGANARALSMAARWFDVPHRDAKTAVEFEESLIAARAA